MNKQLDKSKQIEYIKSIRQTAPRPFGLYSATCIGLDGGLQAYLQSLPDEQSHFVQFTNGLNRYRNCDYIADRLDYKILDEKGRVKLLEFADSGIPILLVPSMINKYYIFDLYEENSLIRYLIKEGYRPFVIDWDTPSKDHPTINLTQAIEEYLLPMSEFLNDYTNNKVHLLGYCMGGVFALIAAAKQQQLYKSLNLVATPYDFQQMPFAGMMQVYKNQYLSMLNTIDVCEDLVQSVFYMQDAMGVINRIKHFANVEDEKQLQRMVSLEDWLSDCITLEKEIAKDCVSLWYGENKVYTEELDLKKLRLPVLLVTAARDEIVPQAASIPLLEEIVNIEHIEVDSGHIGIMVGRKSLSDFYQVLSKNLAVV